MEQLQLFLYCRRKETANAEKQQKEKKSWSFKKNVYLVTEVSELLMQIKSSAQGHATTVK